MFMSHRNNIKFSIITVMYNAEKYAEKTILSVINQSYKNIQYIVVDGNSIDHTKDVLSKYKDNIDVLISEKDNGIYDAMNKGISVADGDYLVFMNAGDRFASSSVLEIINNSISIPTYVYYGNTLQVFADKIERRNEKTNCFRITRFNICHQSLFYPSSLLKKSPYNLRYNVLADWALNIKLMGITRFKYVEADICEYDMDGVSSTDDKYKDPNFINDFPMLIWHNLGLMPYLFFLSKECFKKCLIWRL